MHTHFSSLLCVTFSNVSLVKAHCLVPIQEAVNRLTSCWEESNGVWILNWKEWWAIFADHLPQVLGAHGRAGGQGKAGVNLISASENDGISTERDRMEQKAARQR